MMDVIEATSVVSQLPLQPTEPDLLIDIITSEILPKLPAKSLVRFKTVCKSFEKLISSSEFISLHLCHSRSSDSSLLINAASTHTLDIYDLDSLSSAPVTPSATFRWPVHTINVIGSCNGLLLITISRSIDTILPLVMLNPSTRSYININSSDPFVVNGNLGLGFDHHTNDYKIVVVLDMFVYVDGVPVYNIVTTVYSVHSKSWKRVDERRSLESMDEQSNGVLIDNHLLHWMFWTMNWGTYNRKCRIGCFDVISEKWMDDVLLPDDLYDPCHKNYFLNFGVLDNCLFSSYVNQVNSCFDVWVMKEYGVHESWNKLFSIDISYDVTRGVVPVAKLFRESRMEKLGPTLIKVRGGVVPVAFRGRDKSEVLLRNRLKSKHYWWYNWKTNVITEAKVADYWGHQPCIFKGSLVRLPDCKLFGAQYEHDPCVFEHTRKKRVYMCAPKLTS